MADGGSLIPNVPVSVAPITAQYGGVPAGVARQGTLDAKKRVEEIRKEQEKKEAESASIVAAEGNDRSQTDFVANTAENTEKAVTMENIKERSMEKQKTEDVESSEEKSVEAEPKKSTIGDDVIAALQTILKGDQEYQDVLALLAEADPSKLRSNILFNPDYKVIASLLKQIVRFKVEQYAKGLEEVRGTGEATSAKNGEAEATTLDSTTTDKATTLDSTTTEKAAAVDDPNTAETVTGEGAKTGEAAAVAVAEAKLPDHSNAQKSPSESRYTQDLKNLFPPQMGTATVSKPQQVSTNSQVKSPITESFAPLVASSASGVPPQPTDPFANLKPFNYKPSSKTGGVKSRKASRVLRKLKTMKKSKKHAVPLL